MPDKHKRKKRKQLRALEALSKDQQGKPEGTNARRRALEIAINYDLKCEWYYPLKEHQWAEDEYEYNPTPLSHQPVEDEPESAIPDEWFGSYVVGEYGVYKQNENGEFRMVCSELRIAATSRDKRQRDWGKLLWLRDPSGNKKEYHMRSWMLSRFSAQVVEDLMHLGLEVEGGAKKQLVDYLFKLRSSVYVRSAHQPGWCGKSFVLPEEYFGAERILLSSEKVHPFRRTGTLREWKSNVAAYCHKNPRLVFGLSVGFAAPLLRLVNAAGGGFHIYGEGGSGKTTMIEVASSVYGNPEEGSVDRYIIKWDATKGALELAAETVNDCLMAIDELGMLSADVLVETLHMIADGQGKNRMIFAGKVQKHLSSWRVLLLTSGNVSIEEHLATVGRTATLAQERRLLQIPADAGHGFRLFTNIHGFENAVAFSDHLKRMSAMYHGQPIRAFLKYMTKHPDAVANATRHTTARFVAAVLPNTNRGVSGDAAKRFGIVAAGGEIASQLGITGLPRGEAFAAARVCFAAWQSRQDMLAETLRQRDPLTLTVDRIRRFILSYKARFVDAEGDAETTVGYVKNDPLRYLILPKVFTSEECAGPNPGETAQFLKDAGYLVCSKSENRLTHQERVQKRRPDWFYVVRGTILNG